MSTSPQHWIASDAGSARAGNEDAFLYLGPDETGGGSLWLVVDGEGGPGVGDLAAAMFVVTVGELYAELLDAHGDPVTALEFAAREADARLRTIGEVYPRLAGVRASFAAVAHHGGALYAAWAGTAAVYAIRHGDIERLGAPEVARSLRSSGDYDPVPASGLRGEGGPLLNRVTEPIAADSVTLFVCTDGLAELVPEGMIAQAVDRLSARDAVDALLELSRLRWSDDDATAALVRFMDPNFQMFTTKEAFLEWAESGMTKWPEKTLVLHSGSRVTQQAPPRSNVDGLPPIGEDEPTEHSSPNQALDGTLNFSPDQVRAIVEASTRDATATPDDPSSPAAESEAATRVFAAVERRPAASHEGPTESGAAADEVPHDAPAGDPGPAHRVTPRAESTGTRAAGGTMFFSPQEMERIREASGGAERVEGSAPAATLGDRFTPPPSPETADATVGTPTTRDVPSIPPGRTADLPGRARTFEDDVSTVQRQPLGDSPRRQAGLIAVILFATAAAVAAAVWWLIH